MVSSPSQTTRLPSPWHAAQPSLRLTRHAYPQRTKWRTVPPAVLFTNGFDPLRDVGVEYGHKLQKAGVQVMWKHCLAMTHGFLQMALWSEMAMEATRDVGKELKKLAFADKRAMGQAEKG